MKLAVVTWFSSSEEAALIDGIGVGTAPATTIYAKHK